VEEHEVEDLASRPASTHGSPVTAASSRHFADLLHALNQPVTGLQCLFEVGLLVPQSIDQHRLRLSEGLGLVGRLSRTALAMRALLDIQSSAELPCRLNVGEQVKAITNELSPVAQADELHLDWSGVRKSEMTARPEQLRKAWFRTLSEILRQTARGGTVKLSVQAAKFDTYVQFHWPSAEPAPLRTAGIPEGIEENLGWTLARLAFESEGGTWQVVHSGGETTLTVIFERRDRQNQDLVSAGRGAKGNGTSD